MNVFIERESRRIELEFRGSLKELFEKLDLNSESILAVRDGELLADSDEVSGEDYIKIISVVSGG